MRGGEKRWYYKCSVCGVNAVEYEGNICELCGIGQDPYAAGLQGSPQKSVGRRASHNNVVAKTIRNRATGTTVSPEGAIPAGMVWFITILLMTTVYGLGTGLVNGATAVLTVQRVTVFAILLLCLFNLSLVLRIVKKIFGFFFFIIKKLSK